MSYSLRPHELQHARLPCPSLSPRVCSNSYPLNLCHPNSSSSVTPFSSCPPSFLEMPPASGSFPMSQFFESGGQRIGASALASVLPMNIQGWYPLGLTGLISLQSMGLSSLLQHHSSKASVLWCSAFMVQLSNSHITTGKTLALTIQTFIGKVMSLLFSMLSRFAIASYKEQASFNFMAAVTICSDSGAQENEVCHCWYVYLPWSDGTRCHDLSFLNVEF